MAHVSSQAIGTILAHYSDVIEGGSAYNGGTSYRGIPGTQSNDPGLRLATDTPLTSTAGSAATTTFKVAGGSWESSRWAKVDSPGYFAVCTSATNGANVDAARRITAWNDTTKVFTVDAFPASTTSGDVFAIRQGFKRIPNGSDIEEFESGFDRFFHLSATAGEMMDWHGGGTATYKTTLELRLRFLKHGRAWDAVAAAMENLAIIRPILCRGYLPDHRESSYTRALVPMGGASSVVADDKVKVVVVDKFELIYRLDTTFA